MARLRAVREPVNLPATRAELRALGQSLVPAARAGDFNQAMMELGALVCVPRTPDCADCPVRAQLRDGAPGPRRATCRCKQRARHAPRGGIACALVERAGRVLLVRRQPGELLAGTWALPSAHIAAGVAAEDAARAAATAHGVVATSPPVFRGRVRHVFTHRDLTAEVFSVAAARVVVGRRGAPMGRARRARGPGGLQLHAQDAGGGNAGAGCRKNGTSGVNGLKCYEQMMLRLAGLLFVVINACATGSAAQLPPAPPPGPTEPPPFGEPPTGTPPPGSPVPMPPPIAGTGTDRAGADADFVAARGKFDQGDAEGARAALEAFVTQHPGDPARPSADLLLARLALARGDAAAARTRLDPLTGDPTLGTTAR